MVDIPLVNRKLVLLDRARAALLGYPIASLKQFKGSHLLQKAVEKTLQEMIEICMDVGKHIIADEGFGFPEDGKGIFRILEEKGVIRPRTAAVLMTMVGFRNLIVHLYETIDPETVYGIRRQRLKDFDLFTSDVRAFLKRRRRP